MNSSGRFLGALAIILAAPLLLGAYESAQSAGPLKSAWDGVYSKAQADKGRALYGQYCGSCHYDNLDGDTHSPGLRGDDFLQQWSTGDLRRLYSRIISTMPEDDPGTLGEAQVLDVLAYILQANAVPAGERELRQAGDLDGVTLARDK